MVVEPSGELSHRATLGGVLFCFLLHRGESSGWGLIWLLNGDKWFLSGFA